MNFLVGRKLENLKKLFANFRVPRTGSRTLKIGTRIRKFSGPRQPCYTYHSFTIAYYYQISTLYRVVISPGIMVPLYVGGTAPRSH